MGCAASPSNVTRPRCPRRHGIAVEQTPFDDVLSLVEELLQVHVPSAKALDHFFPGARHVPRFFDPLAAVSDRHHVHRAAARNVVGDHVPMRAEPEGRVRAHIVEQLTVRNRDDRPPAHRPGEARGLVAEECLTDDRMQAVCPDDHVGLELRAVGKHRRRRMRVLFDRHARRGTRHRRRIDESRENAVKIGAMDVKELCTVQTRAFVLERRPKVDVGGLPVASDNAVWQEADVAEGLPQAERAKHLHAVGGHLDARADFAEGRCALEDAGLDAELSQRSGQRDAANAASDDSDLQSSQATNRILNIVFFRPQNRL